MNLSTSTKSDRSILVVDVGNSTISINGFSRDKTVLYTFVPSIPIPNQEQIDGLIHSALAEMETKGHSISGAIISSVVRPITALLRATFAKSGITPMEVSTALDLGIDIHADHPEEVGADLLCDAIGAKTLFGGDTIVADLGTASKLVLVDGNGDFDGCCIGVGLGMAKSALNAGTDLLPEVSLAIPKNVVGRNTIDCINSTLTYGKAEEIKGLCRLIEEEKGKKLRRVLTGGYGHVLAPLLKDFVFVPHLIGVAANELYWRNHR